MRIAFARRDERPISAVPAPVKMLLVTAFVLQIAWHALSPRPAASAANLEYPPEASWLRVASLGEPILLSELLVLHLQAFDNQPGLSIPFNDLDYDAVQAWLER